MASYDVASNIRRALGVAGRPGQAVTAAHIVEAFTALKQKYPAAGALFETGRSYTFEGVDHAYIQLGVFRQCDEYNSSLELPVRAVSGGGTPPVVLSGAWQIHCATS